MGVLTKEELLGKLNARFGEDTSDETISLIEDVSDTFDSMSSSSNEDWKAKYEENDSMWRQKYMDRFMGKEEQEEFEEQLEKENRKDLSFESLFEVK